MQRIKKSVRKFVKENNLYDRPLTIGTLERIITKQGFEIVYYDLLNPSVKSQVLSERLNLKEKFQNNTGFTYCQPDIKAVFVKQTLNEKDKLSVLIHEEAHIYLDHFYRQGLEETTTQHEKEANAFELMLYEEIQKGDPKWRPCIITPTVASFVLAVILIFRMCSPLPDVPGTVRDTLPATQKELLVPDTSNANTTRKPDSTSDLASDTVYDSTSEAEPDTHTYYWTDSGTVYHMYADCQHLKNSKDVQSGSKDDSKKERLCKTCQSRYLKETYGDLGK